MRLLHDRLGHRSHRDWRRNDRCCDHWRRDWWGCHDGGRDWRCYGSSGHRDRLGHHGLRLGRDRWRNGDWNSGWRSTVRNGWNSIRRRKLRWNDVLRTHWQSHVVSMWRRCHPQRTKNIRRKILVISANSKKRRWHCRQAIIASYDATRLQIEGQAAIDVFALQFAKRQGFVRQRQLPTGPPFLTFPRNMPIQLKFGQLENLAGEGDHLRN